MLAAKPRRKPLVKEDLDALRRLGEQWDKLELEMGLRTKEEQDQEKVRLESKEKNNMREFTIDFGSQIIEAKNKEEAQKIAEHMIANGKVVIDQILQKGADYDIKNGKKHGETANT